VSDDRQLIERARGGDLDAFAELVRSYERRVRGLLSRLLDDRRDVEEVTQDTFVQAWRGLDRFEGRSAVFTWLYRIAVNEALMRRRRPRAPTQELDELAERNLVQTGEDPVETAELRHFLLDRIAALPFEYRAPLVLRDLEGLSNAEVADALGLSVVAAKSRIHRARMTIRAELEAWEGGPQVAAGVSEDDAGMRPRAR
jgi:RNA polymerase sigma-70 factor (ECF subfamily)